jgi:polynucleotide 5'-kinase involved in rRNA processing
VQPARRVEVPRGHTLLMKGPASARCVSGKVEVFGYRPPANELIVARPWKTLPIHALEDSVLEVSAGPGSSTELLDFDAVPQEWRDLPRKFRSDFRVAFMGRVDSGKTSLLLLSMNERIGEGLIAVADLDVGQPEICPPTTFAFAEVSSPTYRLSSVKVSAIYPFGFTTPSYALSRSVELVRRHLGRLAERGRVLFNLDGWIDGPQAVEHKASLVRVLRPTDVVAIETEVTGELLEACREVGAEVHHVTRPPTVPRRDREERKRAREMGYAAALRNASLRQTVRSWITYYHVLSDQPIFDPERYLLEVVRDLEARSLDLGLEVPEDFGTEPDLGRAGAGLLSYVLDEGGAVLGLSLLLGFSRERNLVRFLANHQGPIKYLRMGALVLSQRFEEIHVVDPSSLSYGR